MKKAHPLGHAPERAQAHRRLLREPVQNAARAVFAAEFGRQDVAVAEGAAFGFAGLGMLAVEFGVETFALDPAPDRAQHLLRRGAKLLDRVDGVRAQAGLHARADAAEVAEFERVQFVRQVFEAEDHEAIGLLHVGGGLGQKLVRRQPDGTGQSRSGLLPDGFLDPPHQTAGGLDLHPFAPELAMRLVDGTHFRRDAAFRDGLEQEMMAADIPFRARFDDLHTRAQAARLVDGRAGFYPEGLGLITRGDAAGRLRQQRHDDHRPVAQLRPKFLLHGGEEGVEVDEHGMQERLHETTFSALFSFVQVCSIDRRLRSGASPPTVPAI